MQDPWYVMHNNRISYEQKARVANTMLCSRVSVYPRKPFARGVLLKLRYKYGYQKYLHVGSYDVVEYICIYSLQMDAS